MHLQPRPHNWWKFTPKNSTQNKRALLQLRVLGFGLLQDGDVGVGVFPEGEEVLVGCERPDAGGVGIRALRSFSLQGVGTRHAQMRQRSRPAVPDDAAVVEDLLELGGSCVPCPAARYASPANVGWIKTGDLAEKEIAPNSMGGAATCRVIEDDRRILPIQR